MLSILLVNDNKIVSRLFQLSSQKHGYDLEENSEYSAKKEVYNILFVDSQIYDEAKLLELKSKISFDKIAYLGDKGKEKPEVFELLLEKPFLPTDFINLMQENFKVVSPDELSDESNEDDDEFDLDSLDEITLDEDLDAIEELDLDSLDDVEEDVAEEISSQIDAKDEINNVLADIDELDSIDSSVESEIDSEILSEDLVKEALDEVEDESSSLSTEDKAMASVAAASVAAVTGLAMGKESEEDDKSKVSDDLDKLDESLVKEAILGEIAQDDEDIKLVDDTEHKESEEMIESSDLEAIIQNAVSKALNKDMLTKALEDMEIVVSFRKKSS